MADQDIEYPGNNFEVLGIADSPATKDKPTGEKPFSIGSQAAVDMLESIMPAEKAQAVPYVLIWEIDASTGKPIHENFGDGTPKRPLSVVYTEPPMFGTPIDGEKHQVKFRERPPVSLERISIKTSNPKGIILYRTVDLSFVVHRPEIVFDDHIGPDGKHKTDPDEDSWSSLVTPGQAFALEYGWSAGSGVRNGLLTEAGFDDDVNKVHIPSREQIRFWVTSYKFNFGADNQIKFNIQGYELGESGLRQAYLVKDTIPTGLSARERDVVEQYLADHPGTELDDPDLNKHLRNVTGRKRTLDPYANDSDALRKMLKTFQNKVAGNKSYVKIVGKKKVVEVPFGVLIDEVFAPVISKSFGDFGFDFKKIFVGRLNKRVGKPAPKYAGGKDMGGRAITDFAFPLEDVTKVFTDLIDGGVHITVYNFIEPFLRLFSDAAVWDRTGEDANTDRTIPEIVTRTISKKNKETKKIDTWWYIFDVNTEFTKFSTDGTEKGLPKGTTRSEIKDKVNAKGVPFVSLSRANSYIQSANFDTIQDELMSAIFIQRYFGNKKTSRSDKTEKPMSAGKENAAPAAQQIYSPVIQGTITMIGNFVLDTFGLIWLDFGVSRWDGPFTLFEREDVIERGSFLTTLKVYSNCTDPLGTKSGNNVV